MDVDVTKVLEALINGIFGGGLALGIFNWFRVRKSKRAGVSSNEQVAAVQTTPKERINDPLLSHLRAELKKSDLRHQADTARIDRLEAWIWMGKPPPPPD